MPVESAPCTKCIGGWVGLTLLLNALGYRQESLTPAENRVMDTLVSCSQLHYYIDNLFIVIISRHVVWLWYTYKFSLSEKNHYLWVFTPQSFLPFFCTFRICTFFARFRIFLFLCFISQLFFFSFALSLSYNCLLQYLHSIPFHLSVPSLHLPFLLVNIVQRQTVTKLYTHKFKALLGLHHAASNMLKCKCVLKPKLSPNSLDRRVTFLHANP